MLQARFPFLVNIAICMKMTSKITNVITQHKECWLMLFNLLMILGMLLKFLKVVMLCIMVLPRAHLTPRGIVICRREMDFSTARTRAVQKKSGNSKQLKMRTICPHLHILFCVYFFVPSEIHLFFYETVFPSSEQRNHQLNISVDWPIISKLLNPVVPS